EIIEYEQSGSLKEINSENLIFVSPNPVSESAVVEIKIQGKETYTAELYNIFGQKIKEFADIKNNRFTIERGNCESGMYFLILKKEDSILASKKILFQ
ncbi:MAG TPA: T9SS type A sorting domain-containing protein, partial [Bacteroidales bacterium]|nr:T9SS type A sorting domain-containing protein [Bacteroidales bacterium]